MNNTPDTNSQNIQNLAEIKTKINTPLHKNTYIKNKSYNFLLKNVNQIKKYSIF